MDLHNKLHREGNKFPAAGVFLILAIFAIYAAVVISEASVLWFEKRWFCLLDDAMISMRFAKNLAQGHGLVWNAGERIEGITNPGWTIIMWIVHLLGVDTSRTSLYVQIVSVLTLLANQAFTAALAWRISKGSAFVTLLATAVTAFFYPLNYFSIGGMETGLLSLVVTSSLYFWCRANDQLQVSSAAYILLGLGTIIRIDAVVPLLVLGAYGILVSRNPRHRLAHCLWLLIIIVMFIGGQTLARLIYYGAPLPNTYYLKMTGFPALQRIFRGLLATWPAVVALYLPTVLVFVIYSFHALRQNRGFVVVTEHSWFGNNLSAALPVFIISLAQVGYSVYVGGDAWEWIVQCNRYMVIVIPATSIILALSIKELGGKMFSDYLYSFAPGAATFVVILLTLILVNVACTSDDTLRQSIFLERSRLSEDNEVTIAVANRLLKLNVNASICSDWAGGIPYFMGGYAIDPLGKCDKYIAHMSVPKNHWDSPRWEHAFYPGHMKWDASYTWRKYAPDFLVFRWPQMALEFKSVTQDHYDMLIDHRSGLIIYDKR